MTFDLAYPQIPDVLEAITTTHKSWCKAQRKDSTTMPNTPASLSRSITNTASSLRYEAYEPPSSSLADLSMSRHSRESRSSTRGPNKNPPTPDDLALFDADEEDGLIDNRHSGGASRKSKLGRKPYLKALEMRWIHSREMRREHQRCESHAK
jgi:hypothetical protein